jgi:hypothetical protein
MAKIIDCSFEASVLKVSKPFMKELTFEIRHGWSGGQTYELSEVEQITEIEEENYRSSGKAVAGAIIGGVLTGGIGLLAGAAIGGRKRKNGTYFVKFNDGEHIAFSAKGSEAKLIFAEIHAREIKAAIDTTKGN